MAVPTQLGSQFGQPGFGQPQGPGMVMPQALGGGGMAPPAVLDPTSTVQKPLPKGT